MIYGAESRTRYTKRGIQNSKKGSYKKAVVKISEGDRIDFFANL
jgi:large subunit ribosomal protein L23